MYFYECMHSKFNLAQETAWDQAISVEHRIYSIIILPLIYSIIVLPLELELTGVIICKTFVTTQLKQPSAFIHISGLKRRLLLSIITSSAWKSAKLIYTDRLILHLVCRICQVPTTIGSHRVTMALKVMVIPCILGQNRSMTDVLSKYIK